MSAKVALRSRAMEGSETATMFESSMITNDTPEAQSRTRARRPLTHRTGAVAPEAKMSEPLASWRDLPIGSAEPRVIGDVEQRRAETFASLPPVDSEEFVLRRLPKRPRLAMF